MSSTAERSGGDAGAVPPELAVAYRVGGASLIGYPYPHFYVRDVFPRDFYQQIQRHLPLPEAMPSLEATRGVQGYPQRFVMNPMEERPGAIPERQFAFWRELARWMLNGRLGRIVLERFASVLQPRLQAAQDLEITDELLLVHDRTRYCLGPHTDSPRKLVSLLFYLPSDEQLARHGTSIYVPVEEGFTCPGGPHYSFERFRRMATMPFLPNALFGFAKTDHSFHGVEPVDADAGRWLLLYDLRLRKTPPAEARGDAAARADGAGPTVTLRF